MLHGNFRTRLWVSLSRSYWGTLRGNSGLWLPLLASQCSGAGKGNSSTTSIAMQRSQSRFLRSLEEQIAKVEKDLAVFREEVDICLRVLGKPTSEASSKESFWKANQLGRDSWSPA